MWLLLWYHRKLEEGQEQVGSEKQKKKKSKKNKCSSEEETKYTCSEQVEEKVDKVRSKQHNRKNKIYELDNSEISSGIAKKRKMSENGSAEESNIESDNGPKTRKNKNKKHMLLSSSDVFTSEKESMRPEDPKEKAHHLSILSDFHHDQHSTKEKRKKKKKSKTSKNVSTPTSDVGRTVNNLSKKHKRNLHAADQGDTSLSDARLRAYGINPKKYKNKLKYGNRWKS